LITFEEIVNYLGQPRKTINGHCYWMCPHCRDNGKDNLVYTHKNGLLTCFANDEHSRNILSEIGKENKNSNMNVEPIKPKPQEKTKSDLTMDYIIQCAIDLSECEKSKEFLKKHRGLYGDTLKLGMGIDKLNKRWIFPCFDIQTNELFGAEYRTSIMMMTKDKRPKEHKGLSKAPGTSARLCLINNVESPEILIITEGFIDAYTLFQILHESETEDEYITEIGTPSNGVGTIKNLLDAIPINKYKKIVFWLDEDDAGENVREYIRKNFKANYAFKRISCRCCNDINEFALKHLWSK
jgi:5S rRNA maturation endonuclease (ribonuclease M5)